ncbi:AraC family transcriptional regulator [Capsulimonas corticalis]|uniref:AraC family transcriptional regulator n=1 Tax=Capsulimonas corticalis TaxID=2219043 RepID=A0A402CSP6_9BACT|nr:AraC family transcriptional regulator [Capsulimonas corticalis]BDI31004.1 AraC family transcriptional regulator [Capsulimonas corticalis]
MALHPHESQILYFNDIPTPLGQITGLGVIRKGTGTERGVLRVYGNYALVYFLEGVGEYCDANGRRHRIVPGDLVLVTPELPHRYTTRPGKYWSECYVIFDGPVFDLCRAQGVLDAARPIRHLEPVDAWLARLQSVIALPASQSPVEKAAEVSRLLALLMEIYARDSAPPPGPGTPAWLSAAKAALDAELETEIDLPAMARELGVSYETFRKGFQKHYGVSPGLYRTQRRLAVAGSLLKLTTMTHQRIASHLGFSDEFHFSKRFKQIVGVTPREYRRAGPQ